MIVAHKDHKVSAARKAILVSAENAAKKDKKAIRGRPGREVSAVYKVHVAKRGTPASAGLKDSRGPEALRGNGAKPVNVALRVYKAAKETRAIVDKLARKETQANPATVACM